MGNDSIIGVEIGGTKLQLAVGTLEGEILYVHQGRVNATDGAQGILTWLRSNMPIVLDEISKFGNTCRAIGCGFGGPISTAEGRILKSVHINSWDNFQLKQWLQDNYHVPAVIANDTNAAAWGEYNRGSGRGTRQFFYTNIGSGIGGGIIIDGKLYDGQGYGAGEFGQTFVPDWTSPTPGADERLENLCSGWSIEKRLRHAKDIPASSTLMELCGGNQNLLDCRMLHQACLAGDDYALREIHQVGTTIGIALANVLALVTPERIAIGGGVSNMGDFLLAPIRKSVKAHDFVSFQDRYDIDLCELEEAIVLVGAILLARDTVLLK